MKIAAIVKDIEGTTGGTGFSYDVLMPYSLKHLGAFVREHQEERDVMRALVKVSEMTGIPLHNLDGIIRQLAQWIRDEDAVTALKTLQGMLWEKAYKQGLFQSHVYPDVPAVRRSESDSSHDCNDSGGQQFHERAGSHRRLEGSSRRVFN